MKKVILSAIMLFGLAFGSQAQEISKHAIGVRINGDMDGVGAEATYQMGLAGKHRLELDLGFRNYDHYDTAQFTGLFQWVWNVQGRFNGYAGFGAGLGTYHVGDNFHDEDYKRNGVFGVAAGNIGVEYVFDFPLQVSVDFRPEIYFGDHDYRDREFAPDLGISARYRFL
jgi:hypothetical protein